MSILHFIPILFNFHFHSLPWLLEQSSVRRSFQQLEQPSYQPRYKGFCRSVQQLEQPSFQPKYKGFWRSFQQLEQPSFQPRYNQVSGEVSSNWSNCPTRLDTKVSVEVSSNWSNRPTSLDTKVSGEVSSNWSNRPTSLSAHKQRFLEKFSATGATVLPAQIQLGFWRSFQQLEQLSYQPRYKGFWRSFQQLEQPSFQPDTIRLLEKFPETGATILPDQIQKVLG